MPILYSIVHAIAASIFLFGSCLTSAGGAAAASRLETVKARGYLNCGVGDSVTGFSQVSARGQWSGLDVEFCTALAVAIFGSKDAVKFRNLKAADRFKALAEGEVDVLMRATAWTMTRDTELGARFTGVLFHDGQGFLVPRGHAITSVLELSGASVCVLPGSSGERGVSDFFGQRKMRFQLVTSEHWDQLVKTYAAGGCTVLTGDISVLAAERSRFSASGDHLLLPEMISKEPLGPVVKTGDDQWFSIVRWNYMALIAAEELGLTSGNVESMRGSSVLDIRRFLGLEADLGAPLGLARDWAYQVVKQVGNYAEIFERTLGHDSALNLDRGINSLWSKGGLMYSAPLR
ncbi:MAG: amino acid ABC transporter substrate-binding protein [Hyphomicrobium sp.]|nr:amino acid ABC transporter substrate-binding protein [Hyphomicrobium sp.]